MPDLNNIGKEWLMEKVYGFTERIVHKLPSEYNEAVRYLPASVTGLPGFFRYSVIPYMKEIVDCFDVDSPVREFNIMKGGQIAFTTGVLEAGTLYYIGHIKILPMMYMTADKELAGERIENNFLPMLQQSGLSDSIRSSDEGNARKTGKTKNHLQFEGGGYLVPFGAINAKKMRSWSIAVMLKDELDGWPLFVGNDGDPDSLSDERCMSFPHSKKICRGSTPLIKNTSKIYKAYLKGDQRKYHVKCIDCGFTQVLRWSTDDKVGGFFWDYNDDGTLKLESVQYRCQDCGKPHYEHDKQVLFSEESGAKWIPTATSVSPTVRSYHLSSLYAPSTGRQWHECVQMYLDGWDHKTNKLKDIGKYQVFYNNVLGEPFEKYGGKVHFVQVSSHRRSVYRFGEVPNRWAYKHAGGPILFLTCEVDVQKRFLSVAVFGHCIDNKSFLIDYWNYDQKENEPDCTDISCSVWSRLRDLIGNKNGDGKVYTADDNRKYRIMQTLIDANYAQDTVLQFCCEYSSGVIPIIGRDRPSKKQKIVEFSEWETKAGINGYLITVDYYKDRMSGVLRRNWVEGEEQFPHHFNAPVDVTDKQLKELTVEVLKSKTDDRGNESDFWYRPGNARNELWDLLGYANAGVEIIAYNICRQEYELDTVDWPMFWAYMLQELDK